MSKKLHIILITLFVFNLVIASLALAQTGEEVLGGLGNTGNEAGYDINTETNAPKKEFAEAFSTYATGLAGILGGLFMILTIYAGWLWMSARGNDDQVNKAKAILIGAIIGITIVISARIIAELALVALQGTVLLK